MAIRRPRGVSFVSRTGGPVDATSVAIVNNARSPYRPPEVGGILRRLEAAQNESESDDYDRRHREMLLVPQRTTTRLVAAALRRFSPRDERKHSREFE